MPGEAPSRLDAVKAALILLADDRPPHPAAPAIRMARAQPGTALALAA